MFLVKQTIPKYGSLPILIAAIIDEFQSIVDISQSNLHHSSMFTCHVAICQGVTVWVEGLSFGDSKRLRDAASFKPRGLEMEILADLPVDS
jgi:hypothetical protein